MHDPKHPMWTFADRLLVIAFAAFAMWMFANHFDETEMKSLLTLATALGGAEGLRWVIGKWKGDKGEE